MESEDIRLIWLVDDSLSERASVCSITNETQLPVGGREGPKNQVYISVFSNSKTRALRFPLITRSY